MSFSNLSLMRASRTMLSPFWGVGVLVAFVYVLIVGVPQNLLDPFGGLFTVLLAGPLTLGLAIFSRSIFKRISTFQSAFRWFSGSILYQEFFSLFVYDNFSCCRDSFANYPWNNCFLRTWFNFLCNGRSP